MNFIQGETLWTEKYRPQTVQDCILPSRIKTAISGAISNGEIQHMLFSGTGGTGKCLDYDTVIEIALDDEAYAILKDYLE